MSHPTGRDPKGDAAVERVNAIRAARGLPHLVERNPDDVRADLIANRDFMMLAVAALRRKSCGATIPDALDAALDGKPDAAASDLPRGVARVIVDRLAKQHRAVVIDAMDAELARFAARVATAPENVRGLAHLAIDRIAFAVRPTIAAAIVAEGTEARCPVPASAADYIAASGVALCDLLDRLTGDLETMTGLRDEAETSDRRHETRCRRASILNMLAQLRGDTHMQEEAVRLALVVCHNRPGLRPSDVFRAGAPVLLRPDDADVDAALCAELKSIATADGDGAPWDAAP
ncbi:hypothetical protein [Mycolicibacterium mengxianglii]|uniref:hypothetical protein n=1 Tax=Mycolicibacterium mengxianglii TaxID=2736649 RepID=UPI0018D19383|nr:hypothetical protein [Mycolicibacterium mengxianglii]